MNKDHRFILGILIIFAISIGYALIGDAARDKGAWIWLVVAAIGAGLILPARKVQRIPRRSQEVWYWGSWDPGQFRRGNSDDEYKVEREQVAPGLRPDILIRANYECQVPWCQVRGRKHLHIHHIDMDRANSRDANNLIGECREHHQLLHQGKPVTMHQVSG